MINKQGQKERAETGIKNLCRRLLFSGILKGEIRMERKTALITGASRGIGQAAAAAFAKEGYDLVLNCIHSREKLWNFSKELEESFEIRTHFWCGDVGSYAFVRHMFERAAEFCAGIDLLINNAGISYMGLIGDMSYEDWERVLHTNLTSVFACCKCAVPYMLSRKRGKIINISSDWGVCGASCETAYSASKGGVNAFTRALAKELAPSNIQVNAVACGVIDTDMNAGFDRFERKSLEEEIPAGYFAKPDEVAEFLCQLSVAPAYLTGQVIRFDGGWV